MVFVEYIYFVLYANLDSGSLSILILYIFSPDHRSLPFFFVKKLCLFKKGKSIFINYCICWHIDIHFLKLMAL